jgi:hypothetical protein
MRAGLALALAVAVSAAMAPAAQAVYDGSVNAGSSTATLTGIGSVAITAKGGLLHHDAVAAPGSGSAFASDTDFDSTAAGDQTVPDTGGWTVNVSSGDDDEVPGKDFLFVNEGEPPGPLAYAFGHTFFPGGVPCVVRDPNDRGGGISFSRHPAQETRICYVKGFTEVYVRAGDGPTDFTVLDTEPGVALKITGGPGNDSLSEAANVPSSVEEFHNPESKVYFSGGGGDQDYLTFSDGPATAPAVYKVADGAIRKTGLPPLFFDPTVEFLALYPQDGPSSITIGRTGGASLQLFGNFFGQRGPDRVDATGADAQHILTGSTGDDTIVGSALSDYLGGGGGTDAIDSRDASLDQVVCEGGTGVVKADTLDRLTDCPSARTVAPRVALLRAAFAPKKVKRGKKVALHAVSTLAGKVTLKFKRRGARTVTKRVSVKQGPNTVRFTPPRKLRKGRYSVSAVLAAGGKRSKAVKLSLTLR